MDAGPWADWDQFRSWWRDNVRDLNRLAVTDPDEWERVTVQIQKFYETVPWAPPQETT